MAEPLADAIIRRLEEAAEMYHRLILVVAPAGAGKTTALREVHATIAAPLFNVNLELSQRMLELTGRQRKLLMPQLLGEIVEQSKSEVVLLDNIELLFDVTFAQDPLRLLQGLSRNRTVVAAWNGSCEEHHFTYAKPDHAEFRRYPLQGLMIIKPEATT